MYPFLIGVYKKQEMELNHLVYKKIGGNNPLFMFRPSGVTGSGSFGYSWGVNSNLGGNWGWLRSQVGVGCPHSQHRWFVYNMDERKWVVDWTLKISCFWNKIDTKYEKFITENHWMHWGTVVRSLAICNGMHFLPFMTLLAMSANLVNNFHADLKRKSLCQKCLAGGHVGAI